MEIKAEYNYIVFDEPPTLGIPLSGDSKDKFTEWLNKNEPIMKVRTYGDELLLMDGCHIIAHLPRTYIGE